MTPQKLMGLPSAPVGRDSLPRCYPCALAAGGSGYSDPIFDGAPTMVIDPDQPVVCTCPGCGAKALTPWPIAVNALARQVADLKFMLMQEHLAGDPIAQAMLAHGTPAAWAPAAEKCP